MLLSMTGYGAAQHDRDGLLVTVEVRAVNNRYFKLHTRLPDGYAGLEQRIDERLRRRIRRGTVQLTVSLQRIRPETDFRINATVLRGYYEQLQRLQVDLRSSAEIRLDVLAQLPGVVEESGDVGLSLSQAEEDWPVIEQAVLKALDELTLMREREGAAMAVDLQQQTGHIEEACEAISQRVPLVAEAYQSRLLDRINELLARHETEVQPSDVVREVGIFSERADVSEELVRLRSHLDQFHQAMESEAGGAGRKLDFLVQELLREINTIGSKANDAEIARQVVHTKTCIERIREMVQNVE